MCSGETMQQRIAELEDTVALLSDQLASVIMRLPVVAGNKPSEIDKAVRDILEEAANRMGRPR